MDEVRRMSMANSLCLRTITAIKSLIDSGMPLDVAKKAMDILSGKSSMEGFPIAAPWSEESKIRATQYTWAAFYSGIEFYKKNVSFPTPFEKILKNFNFD